MDQETSFAMIVWYIYLHLEELDPWFNDKLAEVEREK